MNQEMSILETLLDTLSSYFQVVKQDPWLLPKPEKTGARQEAIQQGVLAALAKLLKPLQTQTKIRKRQAQGQDAQKLPVLKICELMVAPQNMKLTKQSSMNARRVLNEFHDKESLDQITDFLKCRLEKILQQQVRLLDQRKAVLFSQDNQGPASQDMSLPHIEEIKELLKVSSGVNKIKNENICTLDELTQLFGIANDILQKEQEKAESRNANPKEESKHDRAVDSLKTSSQAFMYRNDIKELILVLFALCEYNLKIIFHNQGPADRASVEATTLSQSPPKQPSTALIDSKAQQDDAQRDSQDQISQLIETHIGKHVGEN